MITPVILVSPEALPCELRRSLLAEPSFSLTRVRVGGSGNVPEGLAIGQSRASPTQMGRMVRSKDPVRIACCRNCRKMKNEDMKLQK